MTYSTAARILQKRKEKAEIMKRLNLNLFRHSEATRTAKFMTDVQLRKRHGLLYVKII